jgi:hypothetical protein
MTAPTANITFGRDAIRFVAGEVRRTVLRSSILTFDRVGARAILSYQSPDPKSPLGYSVMESSFDDGAEAQQIEDWLLDGMPGELQVASSEQAQPAKVDHAAEIGPGSIVEYLGQVYEVSREAHDLESGVRKWRLSGYMSRGVNESALRLVSPFRKGDRIVFRLDADHPEVAGRIDAYGGVTKGNATEHLWHLEVPEPDGCMSGFSVIETRFVHATRELPDGTVAVLR